MVAQLQSFTLHQWQVVAAGMAVFVAACCAASIYRVLRITYWPKRRRN